MRRERDGFAEMIEALALPKSQMDSDGMPSVLALIDCLKSDAAIVPYAAAFIVGRIQAGDAQPKLDAALRDLLQSHPEADIAIEAAMSLALRGDLKNAQIALQQLLAAPESTGDEYKAAFYLAQMGDVSGYPCMLAAAQDEIPHYRLMALRHMLVYMPWQGIQMGDFVIDVQKTLVDALKDDAEMVRMEIPFLLEEIQLPGLKNLLETVRQNDDSEMVRDAANLVLERLQ